MQWDDFTWNQPFFELFQVATLWLCLRCANVCACITSCLLLRLINVLLILFCSYIGQWFQLNWLKSRHYSKQKIHMNSYQVMNMILNEIRVKRVGHCIQLAFIWLVLSAGNAVYLELFIVVIVERRYYVNETVLFCCVGELWASIEARWKLLLTNKLMIVAMEMRFVRLSCISVWIWMNLCLYDINWFLLGCKEKCIPQSWRNQNVIQFETKIVHQDCYNNHKIIWNNTGEKGVGGGGRDRGSRNSLNLLFISLVK